MRRLFLAVAVLAAWAVTTAATPDPALVINAGRDDLTCTFRADGEVVGIGHAIFVANDGGNLLFSCQGVYLAEAPERAETSEVSGPFGTFGTVVITPAGRFAASLHN